MLQGEPLVLHLFSILLSNRALSEHGKECGSTGHRQPNFGWN